MLMLNHFYFLDQSLSLNNEDYLESLIPPERSKIDIDSLLPTNVISMTKLKQLSLSDQIRVILTDGNFKLLKIPINK